MSGAERVRLSRWVNKVEELADLLLEHLKAAPDPLPREPLIDPELVGLLSRFTLDQDEAIQVDYPNVRFLELGNGNQVSNKRRALACALDVLEGSSAIDQRTLHVPNYGICHFAAYTHPKGAMISTPNRGDHEYGSWDWHSRDHIVLFRDAGDGRSIIYISKIEPLFSRRTIGHHGVTWKDVESVAVYRKVLSNKDALAREGKTIA